MWKKSADFGALSVCRWFTVKKSAEKTPNLHFRGARTEVSRVRFNFETENDSEVAAAYLTKKMNMGHNLEVALEMSLNDLDGFFTFVVGTKNGFGVLRDKIACKPAVMAQTDRYVAFGSEFRALAHLPDIKKADVWEPEPGVPYFWGK